MSCIENAEQKESSFLKTKDLFAICQLLKNIPELTELVFNRKLTELISELSESDCYFLTKAIYFDKPSASNWFVAYHQDLSISVDKRADVEGCVNWTFKKGQYGVQPPIEILQDTITIRIHLRNKSQRGKTDISNTRVLDPPSEDARIIIWLYSNTTLSPVFADRFAASKISMTTILFSKADKSVGATEMVPCTTAARYAKGSL